MIGVKRAWRGRGIAGALKRAQIAWAKEPGYERIATANELRNEPIRRLNARLGYREGSGRDRSCAGRWREHLMLVLFDVDKTLFMNSDPLMGRATTRRDRDRLGPPPARDDAIKYVDHPGQTATQDHPAAPAGRRAGRRRRSTRASRAGARKPRRATSSCCPRPTRATGMPRREQRRRSRRSSIVRSSPETRSPWRGRAWS